MLGILQISLFFTVLLLSLQLCPSNQQRKKKKTSESFIKVNGAQFVKDDHPFYINGLNAYWLMSAASEAAEKEKVSLTFLQASFLGANVVRTWAFSDADYYSPLQISPGFYSENMFQTIITRNNSITGILYRDDPTIFAWELINEPRCHSDTSGDTVQAWIEEMAAYVKRIDSNHLLEIGLEGFYGDSMADRKQFNPGFNGAGTDFICNNLVPEIDFATIHIYPDKWIPGSNLINQFDFVRLWIQAHVRDSDKILGKPVLITEFGRSWLNSDSISLNERDSLYQIVYFDIYASAKKGGAGAGGLFWQLLVHGLDDLRDGYEVILYETPSTTTIIYLQSQRILTLNKANDIS